jgi:hypothetical protein
MLCLSRHLDPEWLLSTLFDASLLTLEPLSKRLIFLVVGRGVRLETLLFWGKLLTGFCEPRFTFDRGSG